MTAPLASILIPTFDRPDLLAEALASAVAQTERDIEVVVGDDGHRGEGVVAAAADPRVRYVRHARRLGIAGNWSALVREARAPWLVLLMDDDRLDSAFVARCLEHAEVGVGVVFANHRFAHPDGRVTVRASSLPAGRHDDFLVAFLEHRPVAISSALVRREAWLEVWPMPDTGAADMVLFARLAERGWTFHHLDVPLMTYRVHDRMYSSRRRFRSESVQAYERMRFRDPRAAALRDALLAEALVGRAQAELVEGHRRAALSDLLRAARLGPPSGARVGALLLLAALEPARRVAVRLLVGDDDAGPVDRRPLRVVYLGHVARLSGGELALLRLLAALPDVEAHVILAEDGPYADRLRGAGATVEVLPLAAVGRELRRDRVTPLGVPPGAVVAVLLYVVALTRRLRALRPDLVHTNSLKAGVYGTIAARLAGIPVVWHVRDRIADDYLPPVAARTVRTLVRYLPQAVIANSRATLDTLHPTEPSRMPLRRTPSMSMLYNVVPEVVRPSGRPIGSGEGRTLRVGMVGRISPWKGQHIFLEAFARAFAGGDERAVLIGSTMFGEEDYDADLRDLARRLGIDERVERRGFREDVERELGRLDVLVHASVVPEPFGQVIVEGMAAALPVVASEGGGPSEIIEHERTGLLYPPGDVPALAGWLERLAEDALLRERLGTAGRERVREFGPERIGAQVMRLYEDVLRSARR